MKREPADRVKKTKEWYGESGTPLRADAISVAMMSVLEHVRLRLPGCQVWRLTWDLVRLIRDVQIGPNKYYYHIYRGLASLPMMFAKTYLMSTIRFVAYRVRTITAATAIVELDSDLFIMAATFHTQQILNLVTQNKGERGSRIFAFCADLYLLHKGALGMVKALLQTPEAYYATDEEIDEVQDSSSSDSSSASSVTSSDSSSEGPPITSSSSSEDDPDDSSEVWSEPEEEEEQEEEDPEACPVQCRDTGKSCRECNGCRRCKTHVMSVCRFCKRCNRCSGWALATKCIKC